MSHKCCDRLFFIQTFVVATLVHPQKYTTAPSEELSVTVCIQTINRSSHCCSHTGSSRHLSSSAGWLLTFFLFFFTAAIQSNSKVSWAFIDSTLHVETLGGRLRLLCFTRLMSTTLFDSPSSADVGVQKCSDSVVVYTAGWGGGLMTLPCTCSSGLWPTVHPLNYCTAKCDLSLTGLRCN